MKKKNAETVKQSLFDIVQPKEVFVESLIRKSSYYLSAYANESEVIQNLVKLNVPVYKFDANVEISQMIMRLNWNDDVKSFLELFEAMGIDEIGKGRTLGQNILALKRSIIEIEEIKDYCISKRLSAEEIGKNIQNYPALHSLPGQKIDAKLGFTQQMYRVSGD